MNAKNVGKPVLTIEEFIEKELNLLKFFRDNWKIEQEKNPDSYPEYLFYGDWVEQFNFFYEENKTRETN